MKNLILALAIVALLGGCSINKTPPKNMPAYVKLYPGSTQVMNMSIGGVTADAATTTDTPDTVMIFYRNQASADGLTEGATQTTATTPGQQQATFTDSTGKMVAVIAKPQGTGTLVTVTWKNPPGNS